MKRASSDAARHSATRMGAPAARREKTEDSEQVNATARMRRVIRLGENGPGVEIDAVGLTRIRFRKV